MLDLTDREALRELQETALRLLPRMSAARVEKKLEEPLNIGSLLVAFGRADALVAGLVHTTREVILASMSFMGLQEGVSKPSSFFLMVRLEGRKANSRSSPIAVSWYSGCSPACRDRHRGCRTVRTLLGGSRGCASLVLDEGQRIRRSVRRVREALRIVKEREPALAIDGELQLDAAIIPAVAARKAPGEDLVAGRANILIFPDLNSGNIAYKCVQRFAQADAFGPFFLGLSKTASDLSRGSSVADILGVITMASVHAQHLKGP
jgi:phosphate acetyltransferase